MKKKIVIGILIVLVIVIIFFIVNRNSVTNRISRYLSHDGYREENGLYVKRVSELDFDEYYDNMKNGINSIYEVRYFDVNNYQLFMTNMSYVDGVSVVFSPVFDYKRDSVKYTYEVSMNNVMVVMEGDYKNNNFRCDISSSTDIEVSSNDKDTICSNAEGDFLNFYNDAVNLIDDEDLLNKIWNKS